ncbi:MAG: DinB family protein [Chloroflexia bacterium]
MSTSERARKIESYGRAYETLTQALEAFPREMWHFKPGPGDWSIHEHVVHITDSEANSFSRCRRCIAQPGESVMGYDENQWARALHYSEQSTEDALELFKWLRLTTYKLIQTLPESTWSNTISHPENGTMTLDDWLDVYESHIPGHVEQMRHNYEAWKNGRKA